MANTAEAPKSYTHEQLTSEVNKEKTESEKKIDPKIVREVFIAKGIETVDLTTNELQQLTADITKEKLETLLEKRKTEKTGYKEYSKEKLKKLQAEVKTTTTLEQKKQELKDKAKAEAKKKLSEYKLFGMIPVGGMITGLMDMLEVKPKEKDTTTGKLKTWGMGALVGFISLFSSDLGGLLKKFKGEIVPDSVKGEIAELGGKAGDQVKKGKDAVVSMGKELGNKVEGGYHKTKTKLEKEIGQLDKKQLSYLASSQMLLSLSGIDYKGETSIQDATKYILKYVDPTTGDKKMGLTYKKLVDSNTNVSNLVLESNNNSYESLINSIIDGFKAENTKSILQATFKHNTLKSIIKPNGTDINTRLINDSIGITEKRLNEIYNNNNFDWQDLTIQEISLFYMESFPSLGFIGLSNLGKLPGAMGENIKIVSGNLDIESQLKGKPTLLGNDFIGYLATQKTDTHLGGKYFYKETDKQIKSSFQINNNSKYKEEFEKLLVFKKGIKSMDFSKVGLSNTNIKNAFNENLDFKYLIILYEIMLGQTDISKIPITSKSFLILIISEVLNNSTFEGRKLSREYLSKYARSKVDLNNNTTTLNDEQKAEKVYAEKMLEIVGHKYLGEIADILGMAGTLTKNEILETGITSYALFKGSQQLYARSIARKSIGLLNLSKLTNVLGWITLGITVLGAGSKAMNNYTYKSISKQVNKVFTKSNGTLKIDIEKAEEVIKELEEYNKFSKGEFKVFQAPNQDPIIFYKGKPYTLVVKRDITNNATNVTGYDFNNSEALKYTVNNNDEIVFTYNGSQQTVKLNKIADGFSKNKKNNLAYISSDIFGNENGKYAFITGTLNNLSSAKLTAEKTTKQQ